jgi:hypothetical protein
MKGGSDLLIGHRRDGLGKFPENDVTFRLLSDSSRDAQELYVLHRKFLM